MIAFGIILAVIGWDLMGDSEDPNGALLGLLFWLCGGAILILGVGDAVRCFFGGS